ncbi:MAG: hypothetical protein ACNI3C_05515 [Candidatus Marinarcus sp.]|uniref:hypothetical protein n=1 Tax=Candidatus Marinarcus sp. TaxID=3100987 RepID=UPI003AFF9C07
MSYKKWFDAHANKHAKIMEKLKDKTDDEVIAYFDFENMKVQEKEFCPLYEQEKKCHDMKALNCYLCACPNFRFDDEGMEIIEDKTLFSICSIESKFGSQFKGEGYIHQNCSGCFVPHKVSYIKKHFNRDWRVIMKDVEVKK